MRVALLRGVARNMNQPGYFSNYGLVADHDATLTRWMKEHLQLAVWPKPPASHLSLGEIESALLVVLQPPLNLQSIVTPWTAAVKAARAVMAEKARTWSMARAR
jgi:hypothetical protein